MLLRWAFVLAALVVLLSEGRRGGGGGRSSSRGSSGARSSSSRSSGGGIFGSKSYSGSSGSRSTWFTSVSKTKGRSSGGGYRSSSGSNLYTWPSSNPRPALTRDTVSKGIFLSSTPHYSYSSGCGLGGCGSHYTVYHYYPRSYYYTHRAATTTPSPTPIGPKSDQVSAVLTATMDFNETETANSTQVMEIADPKRPLIIQELAFFWDTKYLPSKDTQGCVSYSPANANSSISYCEVHEYSRCQRELKELPGFLAGSVFFPDGTSPSQLAWMCPKNTGCCDWECCQKESGWGEYLKLLTWFGTLIP